MFGLGSFDHDSIRRFGKVQRDFANIIKNQKEIELAWEALKKALRECEEAKKEES